ncbi:lipocalin family protein [Thalassobellus suaedae]|uniref:Lipocalin family protein n=1 Tax=Thalassobellus suaedae TaxID=3074124 RepID=A0ABY9XST4_9FLAO|nr:lipocalin family protein [Flavobacteriaceae bacterium HL-DH14]
MRNLKKTFLIVLSVFVLSCSNDDKDSGKAISVNDLVGSWLLVSDVDEEGIEYVEEGDCDYLLVFTETTINGQEYYGVNCNQLDQDSPLVFSLNGDFLSFTEEEEEIKNEILELTSTTLKLRYDYVEEEESFYDITTFIKQ